MGNLRISDHLFAFLMNFREEIGKNNGEIRQLTDAVAERIYEELKRDLDKKIKEGLLYDPTFVQGVMFAYGVFRLKDFPLPELRPQ